MDLVEVLAQELKDKNFTDFEKIRYIYLRCCEIFSFDHRWNYFTYYDEGMIKRIEDKRFDIRNIDTNLVVCHSFSISILIALIKEFTTSKVHFNKGAHSFVEVYEGKSKWILDATQGDFPRVKMRLQPRGMFLEGSPYDLTELDGELGYKYVSSHYYRDRVKGTFTEQMTTISEILANSKCRYQFTDALFLYNYLSMLIPQDGKVLMDGNNRLYRLIKFPMFDDQEYVIKKEDDGYQLTKCK